jgi:hypothetical protein
MSDIVIHHINVSYDESHDRVKDFVKYLQADERKEEMKAYYDEARRESDNKIHLNDKFGNEFTMICTEGHNCTLRLRGM